MVVFVFVTFTIVNLSVWVVSTLWTFWKKISRSPTYSYCFCPRYILAGIKYMRHVVYRGMFIVMHSNVTSSHSEVFPGKSVLKISSKFTGEHACRSVISIKVLCNFIEITHWHGCSPVNLLHIFRTPFL